MMNKFQKRLFCSTAVAGLLLAGSAGVSAHGDGEGQAEMTHADKIAVKKATARYHSVKQALRAGYESTEVCVESFDGSGAMGIHFVNEALLKDGDKIDMTQPEALLYLPVKNSLKLIGVEYMSIEDNELFGMDFDDPSPLGGPTEYTLHAWVWEDNSAGIFEGFNPDISCPE